MDPLAARPSPTPGAHAQAPDLTHVVHQLVSGRLRPSGPDAQRRASAELHAAFRAAPPETRRQAYDHVLQALQRFSVPRGFCETLAREFVHHHAGQRLANYDKQMAAATHPAERGQLSAQRQVLARFVGAAAAPAGPRAPAHGSPLEQGAAHAFTPDAFERPRPAPPPPDRQYGAAHRAAAPNNAATPLHFPEPQDFVASPRAGARQNDDDAKLQRQPALSPSQIADRVDAWVEGGPAPKAAALEQLLDGLRRDDLPTALHARAYLRLERAARQGRLGRGASAVVDNYLADTASAQLERLQALAQQKHGGQDIGSLDVMRAVAMLCDSGRLSASAAAEAKRLWEALASDRLPTPRAPKHPLATIHVGLAALTRTAALLQVDKQKTGAALPAGPQFPEVRVSTLTGPSGAYLAYVASTAGRGAFSKFKPVVLADGQVMAARMMRTEAKKLGNAGQRNTKQTDAETYLSERRALHAAGSRFAPTQTLVDSKGRIYDIVELTEGDAEALTAQLTLAQRARVLPVALQDLLLDLERLEAKKFAHRDIKPENVMWLRDGTFGLGDYGLAHQGAVVGDQGTRTFFSPELLDRSADGRGRVDAYALGLTMVEMLVGREGMHGFPLQLHNDGPRGVPRERQAANMRAVHAEWMEARRHEPARPMGPQAQALDLAYQQMAEAEPAVADIVFRRLLHPDPSKRPSAQEALHRLTSGVPPSRLARSQVAGDLRAVSDASPYHQRVRESIALLQAERAKGPR